MINIKRKLFIDFDGTIVNSIKAYCDTYSYYYKNIPGYEEPVTSLVRKWDFRNECPLATNNVENIFGDSYFFEVLDFMPHAKESIKQLSNYYEVYMVTIGTINNIVFKSRWIEKNMPFIKNIILIRNDGIQMNKSMINMENSIFIDDVKNNLDSTNAEIKVCFGKEYEWNEKWQGLRFQHWIDLHNVLINKKYEEQTKI